MFFAGQTLNVPVLFVGVAAFAVLGVIGFELVRRFENFMTPWRKDTPGGVTMAGPVLELKNLSKELPRRDDEPFEIFQEYQSFATRRRVCQHRRPERLRQDHHAAGHQRPDAAQSDGEIFIDGKSAKELDDELVMGFVFQGASLLPWRTSLKNVLLGLEGRGQNAAESGENRAQVSRFSRLAGFENTIRMSFPAACSSASIWRGRWRSTRASC